MDSGMFKPMQMAAVKALAKDRKWYKAINDEYAVRQLMAMDIFDKLKVKYDKAQSGMFVWGKVPPEFKDSYDFSDHYLNSKSVFITPGAIFGKNGERYGRISLCSAQGVFKEVLKRLESTC